MKTMQHLNPIPRACLLIASLALVLVYFQPLWSIELQAPQYPDGIQLFIWVNKITGHETSTLQNINILNHYIGMQAIEPDSIPELKIFPYICAALIALGLLAWWLNKAKYLYVYGFTVILLAVLGVVDFWLWEYDYGHNLDPNAAIQIEGMTYQPPLIGSKWLLNFKAISLPHVGGVALALSSLLLVWAMVSQKLADLKSTQKRQSLKFAV